MNNPTGTLAPWKEDQPVSARRLNLWQNQTITNITVGPALSVVRVGHNVAIGSLARPGVGRAAVLVKVTGNASGGGKYTGRIIKSPSSTPSDSGTLAETDFGALPGADDCYVFNGAEVGKSTHDLTAGTPVSKIFAGVIIPGNISGKRIVGINGVDWENCT